MLIRLIGPVETSTDGVSSRIGAPKLACVLAALAARPGVPVSLGDLINRVWGFDAPESATGVLYSYVARLRAMFRHTDEVQINRAGSQGYSLETDPTNIDIHVVRDLARRAGSLAEHGDTWQALQLWRRAGELAHGEALVSVGGSWAEEFRAQFRQERLRLLADRYAAELALGHHATIVNELTDVVTREPLAEPLIGQLMLAQYRCDRPADALNCFEAARLRLRDRLGADPSPQLRRLHRQILEQDPALDPPAPAQTAAPAAPPTARRVPAQLPAPTSGFIGREAETATILARSADRRIIVVDGMAGVGKTALALRVAHQLAPEFPDGQLFLDLRGYAEGLPPTTPDDALAQLLRSLGTEVPDDSAERAAALRTALSGRRVLMVLDNALDATQVQPLLPGNPGCLTVVTSRRRLVDLTEARPISLDTLPPQEAAEVFAAEAGLTGHDSVVTEIVTACGHLPLAVRIAASRLRNRPTWSPVDLLRRLTGDQSALRERYAAEPGVFAAFDLSYRELDPELRRVFRLLSVFPGVDFDHHAAATLADIAPDAADAALERLVDAHLLTSSGFGRYRLHDLLREYALSAVDGAEYREAWLRLADQYLWIGQRAAEVASPHLTDWPQLLNPRRPSVRPPVDTAEAETWFRDELPVLERLIDIAVDHEWDAHVVELCVVVATFLVRYGGFELCLRLARLGADAARRLGNRDAEIRMNGYLGSSYIELADFGPALAHLRHCLALCREADDRLGQVTTLNSLARINARHGDDTAALDLYLQAAELATEAELTAQEGLIRINAAGPLCRLGRHAEADAQIDRADAIFSRFENTRQQTRVTYFRGVILSSSGDPESALPFFREVADYCERHGSNNGLLPCLAQHANALLDLGRPAESLGLVQRQLELLNEMVAPLEEAEALCQLGTAQGALGRHDDAIESLRASITLATEIGAHRIRAQSDRALGEELLARGDTSEGRERLTRALEFYTAGGFPQAEELTRRLRDIGGGDGDPGSADSASP